MFAEFKLAEADPQAEDHCSRSQALDDESTIVLRSPTTGAISAARLILPPLHRAADRVAMTVDDTSGDAHEPAGTEHDSIRSGLGDDRLVSLPVPRPMTVRR